MTKKITLSEIFFCTMFILILVFSGYSAIKLSKQKTVCNYDYSTKDYKNNYERRIGKINKVNNGTVEVILMDSSLQRFYTPYYWTKEDDNYIKKFEGKLVEFSYIRLGDFNFEISQIEEVII